MPRRETLISPDDFLSRYPQFGAVVAYGGEDGYVDVFFDYNPREPFSPSEFKTPDFFDPLVRWCQKNCPDPRLYHWSMKLQTKAYSGTFDWNQP